MANPTSAQHLAWAADNEKFAKSIRPKAPDWCAVALFYIAVHEVQALILDLLGKRPGNHTERRSFIQANWLAVWGPYDHLYQLSREARYECYQPTDRDLNDAMLMLAKFRLEIAAARGK